MAPGTALAQQRHGGEGITIVHRRRRGHRRGRLRDLPRLELAARATSCRSSSSSPTTSGASPPRPAPSRAASTSPTAARRSGCRPRPSTATIPWSRYPELQKAIELRAQGAQAVPARGQVSRLYGHSCASGANFVTDEQDCIVQFEKKLESARRPHPRADGRGARALERRRCRRGRASRCATSRCPTARPSGTTSTRRRSTAAWRTWPRPSAWRCTTARSTSASPTSSARTSGRRWAACSPARRA